VWKDGEVVQGCKKGSDEGARRVTARWHQGTSKGARQGRARERGTAEGPERERGQRGRGAREGEGPERQRGVRGKRAGRTAARWLRGMCWPATKCRTDRGSMLRTRSTSASRRRMSTYTAQGAGGQGSEWVVWVKRCGRSTHGCDQGAPLEYL